MIDLIGKKLYLRRDVILTGMNFCFLIVFVLRGFEVPLTASIENVSLNLSAYSLYRRSLIDNCTSELTTCQLGFLKTKQSERRKQKYARKAAFALQLPSGHA